MRSYSHNSKHAFVEIVENMEWILIVVLREAVIELVRMQFSVK